MLPYMVSPGYIGSTLSYELAQAHVEKLSAQKIYMEAVDIQPYYIIHRYYICITGHEYEYIYCEYMIYVWHILYSFPIKKGDWYTG